MSWIQKLYETYNNCQSMIGAESNGNEVPLIPICHTTQKAQIEIVIDGEGNFRRARVISKNEARTIIPCTESRAGGQVVKNRIRCATNCSMSQWITPCAVEVKNHILHLTFQSWKNGAVQIF